MPGLRILEGVSGWRVRREWLWTRILSMPLATTISPRDFVTKWRRVAAKEPSTYQEHSIDLCQLGGHETPMETDPAGQGFAWKRVRGQEAGLPDLLTLDSGTALRRPMGWAIDP